MMKLRFSLCRIHVQKTQQHHPTRNNCQTRPETISTLGQRDKEVREGMEVSEIHI